MIVFQQGKQILNILRYIQKRRNYNSDPKEAPDCENKAKETIAKPVKILQL
jgi:hypothetical protein